MEKLRLAPITATGRRNELARPREEEGRIVQPPEKSGKFGVSQTVGIGMPVTRGTAHEPLARGKVMQPK